MTDLNKLSEAFTFANQMHKDQIRTGSGAPYICHIMQVCGLVLEYGGTIDEAMGALFHDLFEDHGDKVTPEQVAKIFGQECVDIALECSDYIITKEGEEKSPWHERKQAYLDKVPHKSNGAKLVTCADKLHNARSIISDYKTIGDEIWDKFSSSQEDTKWYYMSVYKQLDASGFNNRIIKDLKATVEQLQAL